MCGLLHVNVPHLVREDAVGRYLRVSKRRKDWNGCDVIRRRRETEFRECDASWESVCLGLLKTNSEAVGTVCHNVSHIYFARSHGLLSCSRCVRKMCSKVHVLLTYPQELPRLGVQVSRKRPLETNGEGSGGPVLAHAKKRSKEGVRLSRCDTALVHSARLCCATGYRLVLG